MNLFKEVKRFSQSTGKEIAPQWTKQENVVCDFCGRLIKVDCDELSYPRYAIIEYDGLEPMFDELSLVINDQEISVHELFCLHDEFVYCKNEEESCEQQLHLHYGDKLSLIYERMYQARLDMLKEVIEKKEYTIEDFQLEEG